MKLLECLEKSPKVTKIPKKNFKDKGAYPVVSQEKGLINGYWDNENDVVYVDHPLVVFGDHTQVVKLVDFNFVVGADGVKLLMPKSFLNSKYFYYYLLGNPLKVLGYARHFRLLKELDVVVPPLREQERIVAILDEAFAGIATAVANTEKNLANARELFTSFLSSVFSQRDEGWTYSDVRALIAAAIIEKPLDGNHGEIHPKKSDFVDHGVPFLMAKDLLDGGVDQKSCHYISEDQAARLRKGFAIAGDVLLSHKGTIGRCAVLDTDRPFVVLTPQLTYYRVKDRSKLNSRFLYFYFQSPEFLSTLKHIAGAGSTRAYIGITRQLDLPILFPAIEVQRSLASKFDELVVEVRRLESIYQRKLIALAELKQSLLQKAFSGELTAGKAAPSATLKEVEVA